MKKGKSAIKEALNPEAGRQEALESTIAGIVKQFGKGAIMKLGDKTQLVDVPVIPTGALSLDIALGVGGIPKGRIIEVFGPESSGKTTIALHIVAEAQRGGGICGYVDAEHAMDPIYARNLGVNIDELYISQPDDGEQALEIAEAMVRSGAIDVVIVDSVAALTPRAEIEGNMGDSHVGLQARLMSQALRKLTAFANKTMCTIIFINQLRDKIGGMTYGGGGGNETTTGGRALKFYASVRLDIRRIETLKVGESFVGNKTKVKIAKNKVAPPFKTAVFEIMYGQGISREGDLLDLATEMNMVQKSGSWYSYNGERLGQGRDNAKLTVKNNPAMMAEMEAKIKEHFGVNIAQPAAVGSAEAEEKPAKGKKAVAAKDVELDFSIDELELDEEAELEDEFDDFEEFKADDMDE
ncbi:MAG: recombinase RecA [Defluviitaleaceae bacterium]|nr:recombinase RecA [Defluviitaleaceae bacterium]